MDDNTPLPTSPLCHLDFPGEHKALPLPRGLSFSQPEYRGEPSVNRHLDWGGATRLTLGWALSCGVHVVGLALLWWWLSSQSDLPVAQATSVKITLSPSVKASQPTQLTHPDQIDERERLDSPDRLDSPERVNSHEQVAGPEPEPKPIHRPQSAVNETAAKSISPTGLFRYSDPAPSNAQPNTSTVFDSRVSAKQSEARRRAALTPAEKEETVKTQTSIAGQTLVQTDTGCAVVLEFKQADRLDGNPWAPTSCNEKSESEKMADRLRSAIQTRRYPKTLEH